METIAVRRLDGMDAWFTPMPPPRAPPRSKTLLMTASVIVVLLPPAAARGRPRSRHRGRVPARHGPDPSAADPAAARPGAAGARREQTSRAGAADPPADRHRSRAMTAGPATYLLSHTWQHARGRLRLLEDGHDPGTFPAAGRARGRSERCPDIGAGGGRWPGGSPDRVGPEGPATAVDIDTALVEPAPGPGDRPRQRRHRGAARATGSTGSAPACASCTWRGRPCSKAGGGGHARGLGASEDFDFNAMAATATGAVGMWGSPSTRTWAAPSAF